MSIQTANPAATMPKPSSAEMSGPMSVADPVVAGAEGALPQPPFPADGPRAPVRDLHLDADLVDAEAAAGVDHHDDAETGAGVGVFPLAAHVGGAE